jgi:hypothetical protein
MDASGRLRGDNKELQASPAFPVMWAFEYDFVEVDEVDRRASYGPWAPWLRQPPRTLSPPTLGDLERRLADEQEPAPVEGPARFRQPRAGSGSTA